MIDCKQIANLKKQKMKEFVEKYDYHKHKLFIIQVGNNPASNIYVRNKLKDCEEIGIVGKLIKYENSDDVYTDDIVSMIKICAMDADCRGIIVQLPLPKHINVQAITNAIPDEFDVDGFKEYSSFTPCTPKGVLSIFDAINYDLNNKEIVIIGQSNIVGKPMVRLLQDKHCTIVSCNSKTRNLDEKMRSADVIISAAGCRNLVNLNNTNANQVIIDVGINFDENGKQHGDCSDEIYNAVDLVTPRIGGTGLMTRISLLENVLGRNF